MGPLVGSVVLRNCGREFLIRRLDLVELLSTNVWPKPITAVVRQWMVLGSNQLAARSEGQNLDRFYETALSLIRQSVIVPPSELLDGLLLPEDITSTQCRQLFVDEGEEPDEDQLRLVPWSRYEELHDEVAQLRAKMRGGEYAESTVKKYEKQIAEKQEALADITTIHWEDQVVLANEVLNHAGGAHRRFRPVEADVVGGLADEEGDGPSDE